MVIFNKSLPVFSCLLLCAICFSSYSSYAENEKSPENSDAEPANRIESKDTPLEPSLTSDKLAPKADGATKSPATLPDSPDNKETSFPAQLLAPYRADYDFYLGTRRVGSASRHIEIGEKGRYALHFTSEGRYLLMSYTAKQQSTFHIKNDLVQPLHFSLYQKSPFKSAETQEIHFDWTAPAKAKTFYDGKHYSETLDQPSFDALTHILQLRADLIHNKKLRAYPVSRKGETKIHEYNVLGSANLTMYGKTYETLKIERIREGNKRETFTWLDKSNAYFPVRILQKKDGDPQFDIRLKSFRWITPKKSP